jgi:hypothetical protein
VVPVEGCHDHSYEMGGRRWSTYLVTEKLQLQGYEDLARLVLRFPAWTLVVSLLILVRNRRVPAA